MESSGTRRRERSFMSAALMTIRCSQVESLADPSKLFRERKAAMKASWTTSRASSELRMNR